MKRLYVTSLLALLTAGASAQANAPKPDGPGGFPARGERRAGQRMERRAERRADAIKEFDKDGDGKLNEEERKAMMEANRARMEEFRKARKEFDKDGDGKLNDEERKAMMEANRARRRSSARHAKNNSTKMATVNSTMKNARP